MCSLRVLSAVVVLAACGRSDGQSSEAEAGSPAGRGSRGGRNDPNRVIPVEIAIAERGRITRTTTLSGSVEPIRRVGVNSQLSGALLSINVEEGSTVRRDQVLAQLDAREIDLQLSSARASLLAAESAMERAEKLRQARIYTDIEYERDRTALAAALSQLEQLQTRLGYASVKSPLDGVVIEKRVEAGDVVGAQTRLFTIADVSTLVVRLNVSELEVTGMQPGQAVEISIDALDRQTVQGRIRRVFPAADSVSRLVPVEVELTGAGVSRVKPGFLTRATFSTSARENALLIPASAIVVTAGASAVYLMSDGRAHLQSVRPGLNYAGRIEILEGIQEGDTVIVAGNIAVRDGALVRAVAPTLGDSVRIGVEMGGGGVPGGARGAARGGGDRSGVSGGGEPL